MNTTPRYGRALAVLAVACIAPWAFGQSASESNAAGVEYYNAQQWDAALEAFHHAYELAPANEVIRHNLCNTYQAAAHSIAQSGELNDIASGAELLMNAIAIEPENAAPLVQLGSYYLRLDLDNEAVMRLEESLELDPDNLTAMELLGDAYYKTNDLPSALALWEVVNREEPQRPGLDVKIAKANREIGVEGGYHNTESRHFSVSFAPGTRRYEISGILQTLERARRDVGRKLGGIYPVQSTQVIVYTAEDFSEATAAGSHVGALFDGKIRVPIEDKNGNMLERTELERRLYHEYTHVVVRFISGDRIPWWLNEGLAETLSSNLDDSMRHRLTNANDERTLFALVELEGNQLEKLSPKELSLAYHQAHATVDYLYRRFGQRKFVRLLETVAQGVPAEEALKTIYRRHYAEIEREVLQSIARG